MRSKPKPIHEQVIVITGASSGIGLATARMAAQRGARLVLAARNEDALRQLADELNAMGNGHRARMPRHSTSAAARASQARSPAGGTREIDTLESSTSPGGRAVAVVADVARHDDVRRIAEAATQAFGGFDTWINNAAVAIYGRLDEVSIDDQRRLFDVDYWGLVYGSLEAVKHLRRKFGERRGGGTIINIGSVVSDVAIPLQGPYSAAKHAVKGFTDALRLELEERGLPINVTLIKPTSIDTPYRHHAKNYMNREPSFPPPVYAPEVVAHTILHCIENPKRDVYVGGGAKVMALARRFAPRLTDKIMEQTMFRAQQKGDRMQKRDAHNLNYPIDDLNERGGYEGHVAKSSLYTQASLHPLITGVALMGAGLVTGLVINALRARHRPHQRSVDRRMAYSH